MKTIGAQFIRYFVLILTLSGPILCAPVFAQVLVIANSSVAAVDVTKAELRDVFTGASSSLKGSALVTPVLLRQGAVNDGFLGLYIGKSDSAFRAGWRNVLFSGQGMMPKTLNSDAEVVEYVAHTPGAIGYIASTSPHEGVKTLGVR